MFLLDLNLMMESFKKKKNGWELSMIWNVA